jgi:hypothetical protein
VITDTAETILIVLEDPGLNESQKNHLRSGPINVRLKKKLPHGLEIPMAVT